MVLVGLGMSDRPATAGQRKAGGLPPCNGGKPVWREVTDES